VISAATVTGKALSGYVSGAGTLSTTDTILSAINKLNGNNELKANLASPTFTGTVALPTGSTTAAPLRLTAGTNLTSATLGAVEFDGNNLYLTINAASPTRKTVALSDTGSSSQIGLSSIIAAPINPVVAWGNNSNGQALAPVLANVAAVAAGNLHSIALLDDGQVVEWGKSVVGGNGPIVPKPTLTGVTDIAAGGSHNLVRQSNGRVLAWGDNTYDQAMAPTDIVTAVKVAAGSRHSLALLANGTVRGWGESYLGKNAAPASLTGMTVIAIAAGQNHSLALKNTGEVVAWGDNAAFQTDVPAEALSGVTAIAAGWNHNLALKSNGSVVAWGNNNGGQTNVPAAVSSGVVQIAAGDTYSMALKADGTIVTWGFTAVQNPVTVVPDGTTQVTLIAAGGYHALALRADTVPVQLARLDSTGRLGIGRTPLLNALEVEGNASKSTAGSWLAHSDRRIKTDIESITGALDKLDKVRLVDFRYTDAYLEAHPEIKNRRYPNVIAQEFQQVFPDEVESSGETLPDGSEILQVDTYPLTIYSAAAIQELHRENRLLKKKLDDQEQRLRKLEEILKNK
jgi:alpha-tubulin suppressor-like RCC1 family protein